MACWFQDCQNETIIAVADVEFADCGMPERITIASTAKAGLTNSPALCPTHTDEDSLITVVGVGFSQLLATGKFGSLDKYEELHWPELWLLTLSDGNYRSGPMVTKPPKDEFYVQLENFIRECGTIYPEQA